MQDDAMLQQQLRSRSSNAVKRYRDGKYIEASILFKSLEYIHPSYEFSAGIAAKRHLLRGGQQASAVPVLTILDEISELSWHNVFNGFQISRNKFESQISKSNSCFALLESAWHAGRDSWQYAFTSPGLNHKNAQALIHAIHCLRQARMPIVFWNKEDPMHYELFLPVARLCDYILTTDVGTVDRYKKDLGSNKIVHCLPFAASPSLTNPISRFGNQKGSICFAGAYYAQRHESRKKQMDILLPLINKFEGHIYDRCSDLASPDYEFPPYLADRILPRKGFKEMAELYKSYNIFLNVNTITASPTMMSRRVYEILASGTPVISTPSKSIEYQFPGIVSTANSTQEAIEAATSLFQDKLEWAQTSQLGLREVLKKHTYSHRFNSILQNCFSVKSREPLDHSVAIITDHTNLDQLRFQLQLLGHDISYISEIFVTQELGGESCTALLKFMQSLQHARINIRMHVYTILPEACSQISPKSDYCAFLSSTNIYYCGYISDLILTFSYSRAKAATKLFSLSLDYSSRKGLRDLIESNIKRWHTYDNKCRFDHSLIKLKSDRLANLALSQDKRSWLIESKDPAFYIADFFNIAYIGADASSQDYLQLAFTLGSLVRL